MDTRKIFGVKLEGYHEKEREKRKKGGGRSLSEVQTGLLSLT